MGSQGGLSGHRVDQMDGEGMDGDDQGIDGLAGGLMSMDDDDDEMEMEDEVIDIAESIFIKIAQQIVK